MVLRTVHKTTGLELHGPSNRPQNNRTGITWSFDTLKNNKQQVNNTSYEAAKKNRRQGEVKTIKHL